MSEDERYVAPSLEAERVAKIVLEAAFEVHTLLGARLYEHVYTLCLAQELAMRGLRVEREVLMPVTYKGHLIEAAFRVDLVVDRRVIVELKAVESLNAGHFAQAMTYLNLSGCEIAWLFNFGAPHLRNGMRRFVPYANARRGLAIAGALA